MSAGLRPVLRGLCGADVRADGDVHPDEAGGRREDRADEEADRGPPAELVVEAEQQERDDRDDRDRLVLAAEVRRGAFLDGARDLAHPLVARRLAQEPVREGEAVRDGDARTDERKEDGVVAEEAQFVFSLSDGGAELVGAAEFLTHCARSRPKTSP